MRAMRYIGLLFGAAFGFMLVATRLTDYDVIHTGLLFHSAYIYLVMGGAMVVAAGVLWMLERIAWRTPYGGPLSLRRIEPQPRHVWGGLLFGLGWAKAGTCPAVSAAQLGSGTVLGVVVMAGLYLGIMTRDLAARRGATVAAGAAGHLGMAGEPAGGQG